MAIACLDAVLVAEEAAECLRLRRRFDDHERFCHYAVFTLTRPLRADETAAPDSPDETAELEVGETRQQSAGIEPGRRRERVEIVDVSRLHPPEHRIGGNH